MQGFECGDQEALQGAQRNRAKEKEQKAEPQSGQSQESQQGFGLRPGSSAAALKVPGVNMQDIALPPSHDQDHRGEYGSR